MAGIEHVDGVARRIALRMDELGISPFPRNYELLYAIETGELPGLSDEFGFVCGDGAPSQEELDRLHASHVASGPSADDVSRASDIVREQLAEISRLIGDEGRSIKEFTAVLSAAAANVGRAESPAALVELVTLVASATKAAAARSDESRSRIEAKVAELDAVQHELDKYKFLAATDDLTGLPNRRAFDAALARLYAGDGPGASALVVADIDHFKRFNDTYGHPVGDQVLKLVAARLKDSLGSQVFAARTGGEEFAFIVRGSDPARAGEVAERVREAVACRTVTNRRTGESYGSVTISLGLCMAADAGDGAELYEKADAALYEAKQAGRNRVAAHVADRAAEPRRA